jgi:hypothetical protein
MSIQTPHRKVRPTREQLAVLRKIEKQLDELEANEDAMLAEMKALNRMIDAVLRQSARAIARSKSR